jgi:hypothetical protein
VFYIVIKHSYSFIKHYKTPDKTCMAYLDERHCMGVSFTECFILFVFVAILKYIVMNMAKLQVCTSKDLRFTLSKHWVTVLSTIKLSYILLYLIELNTCYHLGYYSMSSLSTLKPTHLNWIAWILKLICWWAIFAGYMLWWKKSLLSFISIYIWCSDLNLVHNHDTQAKT